MWQELRRALGPVDADDADGVDPALIASLAPWVDRACRAWFGLQVEGLQHLEGGPALIVGNHNAGITFLEPLGLGARRALEQPGGPPWAGLAHDGMVDLPGLGSLLVRLGAVRASHEGARQAFAAGRSVMVFPGGNHEAFRPWTERNRLDFNQRKGWIRLALRHGVPIVPVVFHGGHGGLFVVRRGKRLAGWTGLARRLRVDSWPLWVGLPWGLMLGPSFHIPLPVQCTTRVLPPMSLDAYGPEALDSPRALQEIYDDVVGRMQVALSEMSQRR